MREFSFRLLDEELLALFDLLAYERNLILSLPTDGPLRANLDRGRCREGATRGEWTCTFSDDTKISLINKPNESESNLALLNRAASCYRLCRKQESDLDWSRAVERRTDPVLGEISMSGEVLSGGKSFQRRILLLGEVAGFAEFLKEFPWKSNRFSCEGSFVSTKGLRMNLLLRWICDDVYEVALDAVEPLATLARLRQKDLRLFEQSLGIETIAETAEVEGRSPASVKESLNRLRRLLGLKQNDQLIAAWEEWKLYGR